MIDTNVKGFLHTIRAGLPRLLESSSADLVAVTSIAGQRAPEGEAVYAASKHAQIGFMRSLDHELFRRGVRCSILAPGGVETAFAMGRAARPRTPTCPGCCVRRRWPTPSCTPSHGHARGRIFEASILPMADDSMKTESASTMAYKVSIIGGGSSSFVPLLLRRLIQSGPLGDSTVTLMDIDEHRLGVMQELGDRLVRRRGQPAHRGARSTSASRSTAPTS